MLQAHAHAWKFDLVFLQRTPHTFTAFLSINFVLFAPIFIWLEMCKYKKTRKKKRQHKYVIVCGRKRNFNVNIGRNRIEWGVWVIKKERARWGSVWVEDVDSYACVVYLLVVFLSLSHLLCGIQPMPQFLSSTSHHINIQNAAIKLSKDNRGAIPFLSRNLWCVCQFASWFEYALHQYLGVVETCNIWIYRACEKRG